MLIRYTCRDMWNSRGRRSTCKTTKWSRPCLEALSNVSTVNSWFLTLSDSYVWENASSTVAYVRDCCSCLELWTTGTRRTERVEQNGPGCEKKGTRIACMVCVFGGKERKTTHRQCYIYIKAARRGPFVRKLINFSWMSRSPRWCFLSKSWYNNGISGFLFQKSDWMLGREKDGMQMHVYFMIYKRVGLVRNFDSPFRSFCSNDSLNNESDKSMYENVWQVEAPWKWGNPCSLDTV